MTGDYRVRSNKERKKKVHRGKKKEKRSTNQEATTQFLPDQINKAKRSRSQLRKTRFRDDGVLESVHLDVVKDLGQAVQVFFCFALALSLALVLSFFSFPTRTKLIKNSRLTS